VRVPGKDEYYRSDDIDSSILQAMNKNELLSIPVSFYRNMRSADSEASTIGDVLDAIKGPRYESQIKMIRQLKTVGRIEEANEVKSNLHAVTFCATFQHRRLSSMYESYNSLMVIDIDKLDEREMDRVGDCLGKIEFVACYWKSPSGAGWKGLVPLQFLQNNKGLDVVNIHHQAFRSLEEFFRTNHSIILDPSGKDITRLCFMSWCPELVIKECFPTYDVDLSGLTEQRRKSCKSNDGVCPIVLSSGDPIQWNVIDGRKQEDRKGTSYDRRLLERIYRFLKSRNESITSTYEDWVKVAFAIAQTFHSVYGRKMFMKFCELDGAAHNQERSERLIFDAYNAPDKRSDFSTIIYLANRKGFIR